jgi:hypothetical protein
MALTKEGRAEFSNVAALSIGKLRCIGQAAI